MLENFSGKNWVKPVELLLLYSLYGINTRYIHIFPYLAVGLKAFTRGMAVSGLRGFPSNAVTLFGFAELMRWFNKANKDYYG